jgi:hypothetical protein
MKKILIVLLVFVVVAAAVAFIPVGGSSGVETGSIEGGPMLDISAFSDEAPGVPIDLLFIHHSVGGTLLAAEGPEAGEHAPQCIWDAHPNGGGLRDLLEGSGYQVHEASYGSRLGEETDLFDWLPKFREHMDDVLRIDVQDTTLPDGRRNQIVVFKSCFPNSFFVGEGSGTGDPEGPELTLADAQASMNALREVFARYPDVLFVYVTAPPMAPPSAIPLWKWAIKRILGTAIDPAELRAGHDIARRFNNWMRSPEGWLQGYPNDNVVVFDFFDVLTDNGRSNMLRYPTGGGTDSHPSAEGNRRAAQGFLPFINRAVRRAGMAAPSPEPQPAPEAAPEPDVAPAPEAAPTPEP